MFLKRCTRRKSGKEHVYWQLVESYKTPRGPRHRVVSYLGELSEAERGGWARLANMLDGRAAEQARQLSLLDSNAPDDDPVPETVSVKLKGVRVEESRDFGDVFLALHLWRTLGLDELLRDAIEPGREEVPWDLAACVLAIARFLDPSSELHVETTWYHKTALAQLLGVPVDRVTDSRLYRTLDKVLPLKSTIESSLKERIGELFDVKFDVYLYDVTSTYFEGLARRNPKARLGHSRDHRRDCKQVCIGLVATTGGFPLGYEVFAGNRNDVKTLEEIVEAMERKYGRANRIWVFDRGIVSEDNLEFVRERGGSYLVGTPRKQLREFEKELLEKDWTSVQPGIEAKTVPSPDGTETFVLCRSRDRVEKEKAIHEKFVSRIEAGLQSIQKEFRHAKKKRDYGKIERRIGRLLQRNTRASGAFKVTLQPAPERPAGLRLTYRRVKKWRDWAMLSEGCYLLRTNLGDKSPEELWRTYVQLTDVEDAFRAEKSELNIRPIWHHTESRVEGHILFSFLAYAMWKTLQTWMECAGLGRGVRTVLDEFARIKATDIVLPTDTGREVRLCCITKPDAPLRALVDRLGITIPERLGRPHWVRNPTSDPRLGSLDFRSGRPQIGR